MTQRQEQKTEPLVFRKKATLHIHFESTADPRQRMKLLSASVFKMALPLVMRKN